jgi:ElaB/YqjD/DUF883 family membrane-anchored ribosome-binding protein
MNTPETEQEMEDIRTKAKATVQDVKEKVNEKLTDLKSKAQETHVKAQRLIKENPYKAMGFSLGLGLMLGGLVFLIGSLLQRRMLEESEIAA